MPKANMTSKQLIKILQKNGFFFVRQSGSHAIFKNEAKKKKVVVPIHNKDVPTGTLHAILKDARIKL